jgi:sortase A
LRIKNIISWLVSFVLIGAGLALIGTFFFGQEIRGTVAGNPGPEGFNVPELGDAPPTDNGGPEDKTLKLTVPKMSRLEGAEVPTTVGTDEEALGQHAAIHLQGTGFPWQEEANVYLAGHRLGYPASDSYLAFWDLDKLEEGDEVFVEDAEGTRYTYRVFEQAVVGPSDLSVTEPIPGKNILTLQTCTLPDYSQRLIVHAELVDTQPKSA